MRQIIYLVGALICAVLTMPVSAQDISGAQDHPALSRYPGSTIQWYDVQDFEPTPSP